MGKETLMNSKAAIAAVVVIVIVIAAVAIAISGSSDDSKSSDNGADQGTSDQVVGYYSYTCSFVDYYQTNPFVIPTLPTPGNTFAKVDIKIKNLDSDTLTTTKTNFKFTADGITYNVDEVVGNSGFFADEIDKGDTVKVTFYYEVPIGTVDTQLKWVGDENVVLNYSI